MTSGGDAPGMNAAIRAITRVAYSEGLEVLGFERGWDGLIGNRFRVLTPRNVGGILHLGGKDTGGHDAQQRDLFLVKFFLALFDSDPNEDDGDDPGYD